MRYSNFPSGPAWSDGVAAGPSLDEDIGAAGLFGFEPLPVNGCGEIAEMLEWERVSDYETMR